MTQTVGKCAAALDAQADALSQAAQGEIDSATALAMRSLAFVFRIAAQRERGARSPRRIARTTHKSAAMERQVPIA